MTTLEQLKKIAELDNEINFFIEHFNKFKETNDKDIIELYYDESMGIELQKDSMNYRIYDPYGFVTKKYRNVNGYTNWSCEELND